MRAVLLTIALLQLSLAQQIVVKLDLVQNEPRVFRLTFSQSVDQPEFQLLMNSIYDISYHFISPQTHSDTFFIEADTPITINETLQNYDLIFNNPLTIGSGRLSLQNYMVSANKNLFEVYFPSALGILVMVLAYILINFTSLVNAIIEFLQIYCLIMFKNQMKTEMYHSISAGMFMLNPALNDVLHSSKELLYSALTIPFLVVLVAGGLGFAVKRLMTGEKTIVCNVFYEVVVYNVFVNVGVIFLVPLLFNTIEFVKLATTGLLDGSQGFKMVGFLFSYFNTITLFGLIYLFIYMMNPKFKQSKTSWLAYLQSPNFDNFRKMHEGVVLTSWQKRNKGMIVIAKRLAIVCVYNWSAGFEGVVLLLEFVNIFYIFTIRPYKSQVYMNTVVICRLLMFIFYSLVVLGNLYFSLGAITINYASIYRFIVLRDAVFILISMVIFCFVIYELYLKCTNLNYQIRLVREENEFKLQITEKEKQDHDDRYHQLRKISKVDSDDVQPREERAQSKDSERKTQSKPKKDTVSTPPKSMQVMSVNPTPKEDKRRKSRYNFQMINLTSSDDPKPRRNSSSSKGSGKLSRQKSKQKWKKQSLLVQILKDK